MKTHPLWIAVALFACTSIPVLTAICAAAQQPAAAGTASIEGRVLRAGTNEGISRARIVLNKADNATLETALTTLTDTNGRFALSGLLSGRYRLFASHDGEVRTEFGQRSANSAGTPFALAAGQQLRDLRLEMTPTGSISGRVLNRYGEPIGFANVRAYRYVYARGERQIMVANSVRTNDLGEYRLYWLPPGRYLVSVIPTQAVTTQFGMVSIETGPGAPVATVGDQESIPGNVISISAGIAASSGVVSTAETGSMYLQVYYPGVTDAGQATPIELRAGESIAGMNFVAVESRAVHVRGEVVSPTGNPIPNVLVILVRRGAGSDDTGGRRVSVQQSGAFDFAGIPAGSYDLLAVAGRSGSALGYNGGANVAIVRGTVNTSNPRATDPRLGARMPVDVLQDDVVNLRLPLQTGTNVNGRIRVDGALSSSETASLMSKILVHLLPAPSIPQLNAIPAIVDDDGGFHLVNVVPGTYRVILEGTQIPQGVYVKSARYGTNDILNTLMHVEAQEQIPMEIVLGTAMGDLEARVTDRSGAPAASATVVLIPDAPLRGRIELFRTATTDESGKIHLENVYPGNYKLFAWEDIESGIWWDPEFMRAQEARGVPVRVGEKSKESVELLSIR
jgi:hypothetical protein